jgi:hypothetical protein
MPDYEDPIYPGFPVLTWGKPKTAQNPSPTTITIEKEAPMSDIIHPSPSVTPRNAPSSSSRRTRTGASARINADNIWLYRFIAVGVIAGALSAFATSWAGLLYVAEWQALSPEWTWLTPVMIDIPIVVLTLGALAKRSRGENPFWFLSFGIFLTFLSSAANFAHTVSVRGLTDYTDWIGALLNALAPAFVLLTTEVLGSLVTRPTVSRKSK